MKRPLPNLLARGLQLGLRNWPCVVWAYAVNLLFSLLGSGTFAIGLGSSLDHSLAAKKIAGTLDFASLLELFIHLRDSGFGPMAGRAAGSLNVLQLLLLFVLFTGSVFIYVSAEPPRLSVLLRGGVAYFWRFVRAAIVVGCIGALVLGILLAVRAALLARAGKIYVEQRMFWYSVISLVVVLLVALLLRLWWDLVEVYIVRNAMDGDRTVRLALLPALRVLQRHFFRTFGCFLVAGSAGVSALAACLILWQMLPAHQVWLAFLVAQVGLFLLLASRFWQRGLEATLVLAADPPRFIREEFEPDELDAEEMAEAAAESKPSIASVGVSPGASEPTLRDLVQKLRTEPWGSPDAPPGPAPQKPLEAKEPWVPLLERHENKFPLGGASSVQEAAPAEAPPVEAGPAETSAAEAAPVNTAEPKILDNHEKTPHSEKKPLP